MMRLRGGHSCCGKVCMHAARDIWLPHTQNQSVWDSHLNQSINTSMSACPAPTLEALVRAGGGMQVPLLGRSGRCGGQQCWVMLV